MKLQEEIKRAEAKLEQMMTERDTLMERLKVSARIQPLNLHVILMRRYSSADTCCAHVSAGCTDFSSNRQTRGGEEAS